MDWGLGTMAWGRMDWGLACDFAILLDDTVSARQHRRTSARSLSKFQQED